MKNLYLEIVTPEKLMLSEEVEIVMAPGSSGEFGVLEGHIAFLSGIEPGELRYTSGGKTERFFVSSGFAEISNNKVSVLVDAAENAKDIDLQRARLAMERASKRLEKDSQAQDIDFLRAEAALKRATVRVTVFEKAI